MLVVVAMMIVMMMTMTMTFPGGLFDGDHFSVEPTRGN